MQNRDVLDFDQTDLSEMRNDYYITRITDPACIDKNVCYNSHWLEITDKIKRWKYLVHEIESTVSLEKPASIIAQAHAHQYKAYKRNYKLLTCLIVTGIIAVIVAGLIAPICAIIGYLIEDVIVVSKKIENVMLCMIVLYIVFCILMIVYGIYWIAVEVFFYNIVCYAFNTRHSRPFYPPLVKLTMNEYLQTYRYTTDRNDVLSTFFGQTISYVILQYLPITKEDWSILEIASNTVKQDAKKANAADANDMKMIEDFVD